MNKEIRNWNENEGDVRERKMEEGKEGKQMNTKKRSYINGQPKKK